MASCRVGSWSGRDVKRAELEKTCFGMTTSRPAEGCGRLWKVVEGCGRLWNVVEGCGRLWKIVEGCGKL